MAVISSVGATRGRARVLGCDRDVLSSASRAMRCSWAASLPSLAPLARWSTTLMATSEEFQRPLYTRPKLPRPSSGPTST